jgi:hypothetical protein
MEEESLEGTDIKEIVGSRGQYIPHTNARDESCYTAIVRYIFFVNVRHFCTYSWNKIKFFIGDLSVVLNTLNITDYCKNKPVELN